MPIGDFEREVLRLLAGNRNPDSYLGGATVLHRDEQSPRSSLDVDVFHDTVESLAHSSERDVSTLRTAGYEVELHQTHPAFAQALVRRGGRETKIEWVFDSAFRFFPVEPDLELGWRLNFWDAATNKTLALFGRTEPRDYLDCIYLHQRHLALGALAWAAAGKDPGATPELIIDWGRRGTKYRPEDLVDLRLSQPIDLRGLKLIWLKACEEAQALFERLPPSEMGCLYLDSQGKPVCPDPGSPEFSRLTRHFGSVKGAWPRIVTEPT